MLRTALGPAIAGYLEDPGIVEVMLNPDGRLLIDRLSGGVAAYTVQLSGPSCHAHHQAKAARRSAVIDECDNAGTLCSLFSSCLTATEPPVTLQAQRTVTRTLQSCHEFLAPGGLQTTSFFAQELCSGLIFARGRGPEQRSNLFHRTHR